MFVHTFRDPSRLNQGQGSPGSTCGKAGDGCHQRLLASSFFGGRVAFRFREHFRVLEGKFSGDGEGLFHLARPPEKIKMVVSKNFPIERENHLNKTPIGV